MKNYYDILNVNPEAELIDIKKAYRKLALKFHPDKNNSNNAAKIFIEIHEAYEILSDSQKRLEYDSHLKRRKVDTENEEENIIYTPEASDIGNKKAKFYSQMSYKEFHSSLLRELGLQSSFLPAILTIVLVLLFAIQFIVEVFKSLFKSDYIMTVIFFFLLIGSSSIIFHLYKNLTTEYKIEMRLLNNKKSKT